VLARCEAELLHDIHFIREQQIEVLGKYRPEGQYEPIEDFAASQIIALQCAVVGMSAKKRILADGQYSPPVILQLPTSVFLFHHRHLLDLCQKKHSIQGISDLLGIVADWPRAAIASSALKSPPILYL
jgi:hypothetical protein